ncbi:MAG TPA: aminoacyl-tRNA hydrolase [Nocardioides bacterium]|uniref:aminoacyl-tRNA hydrolase n=1 Tax=uncultured Nocardioides sp. TaxID=198441 RepID=UPI000EEAD9DA|nr:aminoacyl-tRNA hydrolase [uncultured Nocardioides sp.]HCB07343.1 aminoacyl-tRNA hydrolase [Nocardioides sp.]
MSDAGAGPWVIVGLGNPGPAYAGHRHNIGYLVADELVRRIGAPFKAHRASRAEFADGRLATGGPRLVVVRPRCYMNEIGGPTKAVLKFFGATPDRLVAIHDELDIPFDTMRVKFAGGDNGHNGLRSLRSSLGTGDFFRVRVGVGRPPGRQDPADFLLSNYSSTERKELPFQVDRAADAVETLLTLGLAETQQRFNS